jgi:hypothetical protein
MNIFWAAIYQMKMDFANGCVERANKQEGTRSRFMLAVLIYVVRLRREALGAPIVRIVAYALGRSFGRRFGSVCVLRVTNYQDTCAPFAESGPTGSPLYVYMHKPIRVTPNHFTT